MSLKNKTILVTGAGSGIGRAVSIEAAKAGATVVLVSRYVKKLEAVYDTIVENSQCPQPAIHPINLLNITPREAQSLAQAIESLFGRLDGIVHCAGMIGQLSPIEHYPAHLWQEVLHLNLTVPFLLSQASMPLLKKAPSSAIIFSTAAEGTTAKAYFGAYTCAKFGLEALKQVLSQELENTPSLQIHSITPSKVATALRAKIYPAEDPSTLSTPYDVAQEYIAVLSKALA